jgi:hypothetical protein
MCAAQCALRETSKPGLPFWKSYTFGPSTKNQRIEAWWNTLADGLTESWKQFSMKLDAADIFDKESVHDIIALRFIYMDKLLEQVSNFVGLHNIRKIRKQKSREYYIPAGVPEELYFFHDGRRDYKTVPEGVTEAVLSQFEEELASYDLEEYQTKEVEGLCKELLRLGGISYSLEEINPGLDEDHVRAYNYLRTALRSFEEKTQFAIKDFNVEPSRGGRHWVEAERQRQEAIRLNRGPNNIPEDQLVSEEELFSEGEDAEEGGSDNEGCLIKSSLYTCSHPQNHHPVRLAT